MPDKLRVKEIDFNDADVLKDNSVWRESQILTFNKVSEDKAYFDGIHHKPEKLDSSSKSKLLSRGLPVDRDFSLPSPPPPKRGVTHVLAINPQTLDMWHEEIERPLTEAESLEMMDEHNVDKLQELIDEIKGLRADLAGNGDTGPGEIKG